MSKRDIEHFVSCKLNHQFQINSNTEVTFSIPSIDLLID